MAGYAQPGQRVRYRLLVSALSVFALVLVVTARPAYADPTPEEIEAQIDAAWRQLEPVIEEYNATRLALDEAKAEAKALAKQIKPLALEIDEARAEVADIAVHAFQGGRFTTLNALLTSGSPYTFAQQLMLLEQMAQVQQEQIAEVAEAVAAYEAEKSELDALVAELTALEEELSEQAEAIDAEIDDLQQLRLAAYGENGGQGELRPAPCPATYPGGAAGEAIKFACAQIGKPYRWGSSGPDSFDCSGLIKAAWAQAGVSLPHNAAQQRSTVRYIDRSELRPGDLVFYYNDLSHAGLYAGDGWIVHASRAGVPVKMTPLNQSPVHSYGRPSY